MANDMPQLDAPNLDSAERAALRELVRGIVVAQGNVFIKEFLRDKGLPIGSTKAEFEENLLTAIDRGDLVRKDIEAWLDAVEGWGDQHIYLYNVPAEIAQREVWSDSAKVRERVEASGLGQLWNARTSQAFPAAMELTGISFDDTCFRLSWHRAADTYVRAPHKDYCEEIDGDKYEFRAYRYRARRAVTRFVLRFGSEDPESWVAGVFIPVAINSPEHEEILEQVDNALERLLALFDFGEVRRAQVIVADVIKNLDHARGTSPTTAPKLTTQATKLLSGGSYVEFGTVSSNADYFKSTAVRRVRRSIGNAQLPNFTGSSGKLQFLADEASGLDRDVKVQLYGEDKRIRIWRQLSAPQVWSILDALRHHQ